MQTTNQKIVEINNILAKFQKEAEEIILQLFLNKNGEKAFDDLVLEITKDPKKADKRLQEFILENSEEILTYLLKSKNKDE